MHVYCIYIYIYYAIFADILYVLSIKQICTDVNTYVRTYTIISRSETVYGPVAVSMGGPQALRLVFPTVAENTSPASILASFLEVLGRKIDNLEDSMDLCLNLA